MKQYKMTKFELGCILAWTFAAGMLITAGVLCYVLANELRTIG
jgi:hypothetical protein